jgi:DNA polymerase (family X)
MMNGDKPRDKFAIAAALFEIGMLLELKGGQYFKARAYKRGARAVAELTEDIGKLVQENRLTSISGVGAALAKEIRELHTTGESKFLKQLRASLPQGVIELSRIPGLSVQKIERLQAVLGISSVKELKAACESGKIRDVKGFGVKTEQKILDAVVGHENLEHRIHIHHAVTAGERMIEYLRTSPDFISVEFGGSLRRLKETVSHVSLVASTKKPEALIEYFLKFPLVIRTNEKARSYCRVALADGLDVTLVAVKPDQYAVALLFATGSHAHLKKLRQVAAKRNVSFGKNSIHKRGTNAGVKSETEVYELLGMQYVPPELREDQGEIEAALRGMLPEDLVTADEIQGMVHCHTLYSDGRHSIEQMAHAGQSIGMKYLTITDHSPTAFYAGGVKIDELQRQWEEIDRVQEEAEIKILKGTESDILADGSLDYPDWILEQFDVIVASIHSRYKMDADKMTKRVVTAMRQPVFKIWGHALGRLIQRRPPFECDVEKILDAVAESRAAVEISGDPYRLDMEPRWIREARKRKIKFVVSVDAHSTRDFKNLRFGIGIARRGWVRRGEVLNTLAAKAFQKAVRPA